MKMPRRVSCTKSSTEALMHSDGQMSDAQCVEALVALAMAAAESALRPSPEARPESDPAPRTATGERRD